MLNLKDTLTLTKSKMKARKGRVIGTAITMSLGLIVLMSASLAGNGVQKTALDLLGAPTNDRWLGVVSVDNPNGEDLNFGSEFGIVDLETGDRVSQEMRDRELVQDVFQRISIASDLGFGLTTRLADTPEEAETFSTFVEDGAEQFWAVSLSSIDEQFSQFYVKDDSQLNERKDGRIPVIVSTNHALNLVNFQEPADPREAQEQAEKKNEALQSAIGTVVRLQERTVQEGFENAESLNSSEQLVSLSGPGSVAVAETPSNITTHDIELVIIGITPAETVFGGTRDLGTSDFLVAPAFLEEIATQLNKDRVVSSMIAEYASEEDLTTEMFGEDGPNFFSLEFETIQLSQDTVSVFAITDTKAVFDDILGFVRRAGYGVGGFLLLISAILVWTSLGRIVRDSRREIGVFRAVGARKRDIVKIVIMYALLVAALAFVISSVISIALTLGASALWGDRFFYMIASLGSIVDVNPPAFAFFGVTPLIIGSSVGATLIAAFVGAFFPARKAAKLDPVVALRDI